MSEDIALTLSKKYKTLLKKHGIDTPIRKQHYFAQLDAESGLKIISENLNYSAKRLLEVFPKYFKTLAQAKDYEKKPQKIANKVYANRMGNGDESSGDGYKYRGRALIMVTGKDNYRILSEDTGIDYVENPDLLLNEADAIISSLWVWDRIRGNKYADENNLDAISDLINIGRLTAKQGDANGYEHRKASLEKMKKIFVA